MGKTLTFGCHGKNNDNSECVGSSELFSKKKKKNTKDCLSVFRFIISKAPLKKRTTLSSSVLLITSISAINDLTIFRLD